MQNSLNLDSIKAPNPNFSNEDSKKSKDKSANIPTRKLNMPNVGVVDVPKISSMPLNDTLALKKKETPKTAYKLSSKIDKNKNNLRFDFVATLTILGCGFVALIKEIKPIVKHFKK